MDKILIADFGSQVTQLIGRRLRECGVYCEIYPYNKIEQILRDGVEGLKGIILSGSPCSVRSSNAPAIDLSICRGRVPVLGICYGAQFLAASYGGEVENSGSREYGRAMLSIKEESPLFKGVPKVTQVWMSHGDSITRLPEGASVLASTKDVENAAFHFAGAQTYAVQFHP